MSITSINKPAPTPRHVVLFGNCAAGLLAECAAIAAANGRQPQEHNPQLFAPSGITTPLPECVIVDPTAVQLLDAAEAERIVAAYAERGVPGVVATPFTPAALAELLRVAPGQLDEAQAILAFAPAEG